MTPVCWTNGLTAVLSYREVCHVVFMNIALYSGNNMPASDFSDLLQCAILCFNQYMQYWPEKLTRNCTFGETSLAHYEHLTHYHDYMCFPHIPYFTVCVILFIEINMYYSVLYYELPITNILVWHKVCISSLVTLHCKKTTFVCRQRSEHTTMP